MSTSGNIIAGLAAIASGEDIADSLTDDDNILGHVATGVVAGGIVGGITKTVVDETGVGDFLDDIFGF
jgi:hypothetical protein